MGGLVYLLPMIQIVYLYVFQRDDRLFESESVHILVTLLVTSEGAGIAYVCWRSYQHCGDILVKRLTFGLLGMTVVCSLHGAFTPAHHLHMMLFLLYGPISRLLLSVCLLYAMVGRDPSPDPQHRQRNTRWWQWCLSMLLVNLIVALLAMSPYADSPWLRSLPEGFAMLLNGICFLIICSEKDKSPLLMTLRTAIWWFFAASLSFLLAAPWNHQWWLAHGLFAIGLSILGYGILKAFQSNHSLEKMFTRDELFEGLEQTQARLNAAMQWKEEASLELHEKSHRLDVVQHQFSDLFELTPDATLLASDEGVILLANTQAEQLFDYHSGALRGVLLEDLVPAEMRAMHRVHRNGFDYKPSLRMMGSEKPVVRAARRDGSHFLVQIRIAGITYDAQRCVLAHVRAADDVVKHYADQRFQDMESIERGVLLEGLLQSLDQIVFELRRASDGIFECFNFSRAAIEMLQLRSSDSPRQRTQNLFNSVFPADLPLWMAAIEAASTNQTDWSVHWRHHIFGHGINRMQTHAHLQANRSDGQQSWLCVTTTTASF